MKAILIGNGMSSYLISNYRNENLMNELENKLPSDFISLNISFKKLATELSSSSDMGTKDKILNKHIPDSKIGDYKLYFEEYFLFNEIEEIKNYGKISNIEAFLKVAKLFQCSNDKYKEYKSIVNQILFNDGENHIGSIDTGKVTVELFKNYLEQFDYIFTTNFDYILDFILPNKEIYHLHGGFSYTREHMPNGENNIIKTEIVQLPNKAHIIWGMHDKEKEKQTKGTFSFPMSFPTSFGSSILARYYQELTTLSFSEFHIWGFSGENDSHITHKININKSNFPVYFYVNPKQVADNSTKTSKSLIFPSKKVLLRSWDDIWGKIKR